MHGSPHWTLIGAFYQKGGSGQLDKPAISLASLCSNFETFDQEHLTMSTIKLVVLFKSNNAYEHWVLYIVRECSDIYIR